jgi:hypothetical protein
VTATPEAGDRGGAIRSPPEAAATTAKIEPVHFPAIRVTLSAATQKPWAEWLDEFVVEGLNDDAHGEERLDRLPQLRSEGAGDREALAPWHRPAFDGERPDNSALAERLEAYACLFAIGAPQTVDSPGC